MRRFFSPPEGFQSQKVFLNAEETRHLRDVLRLREGEKIQIFDGTGKEFLCCLKEIGKKSAVAEIIEEIAPSFPESNLDLTLAIALLKGEKFDLVVQKATELGVSALVPLITKRVEIKISDSAKKKERWQKIILEASKQCGRAKQMEIVEPQKFEKAIENFEGNGVLFAEKEGNRFAEIKQHKRLTAFVGSEGGWETAEIELAVKKGLQIITLGGRILRAETAGIIIPALLQNHFGDLN